MPPVQYHKGKFPPVRIDYEALVPLIGRAQRAIGRFDGVLDKMINPHVLLAPLLLNEAVDSSRIEGTQATETDVLAFEADDSGDGVRAPAADIQEVIRYRDALLHAVSLLAKLPLSQRLVRESHGVLLSGVRGDNREPGSYRRAQVWIGPENRGINEARFVPPTTDEIGDLMGDWERYLHRRGIDELIQVAVLHAEFESIHPFWDGNGRIGRMLVPLFLFEREVLSKPDFYISEYFERHREAYYDYLLAVSRDDDWTGWCKFFLEGVVHQAHTNWRRASDIMDLHNVWRDLLLKKSRSSSALAVLDHFFRFPVSTVPRLVKQEGLTKHVVHRIVKLAVDEGMLQEVRPASGSSPARYQFDALLNASRATPADHSETR